MSIEVATYINDLQSTNPPATDPRSQGDDHLRLIKSVLQNSFPNATRAYSVPGAVTFSSTIVNIVKANGGVVYISTASGAVTANLPSLASADAGWSIDIVKISSDVNPIFITPPSGTINSGGIAGLARARRCIPAVRSSAIWDGSNWFVTRPLALPIGSSILFHGPGTPAGYEWPNGQTLSSAANYPEYNSVMGGIGTPDMRGRVGVTADNLGGAAAGRLGSFVSGGAGSAGGLEGVGLTAGNLPNAGVSVSGSASVSGTVYPNGSSGNYVPLSSNPNYTYFAFNAGGGGGINAITNPGGASGGTSSFSGSMSGSCSASGSISGSGSGTGVVHNNMPPCLVCGRLLVVE